MVNGRYMPNSYLESVEQQEKILEIVRKQMYSLCDDINWNAKYQMHNTVYCGVAGVLYMNLILYEHDKLEKHLNAGTEIVELLKKTKFKHMTSFLEGDSGFHSLVSILYFYLDKGRNVEENESNLSLKTINVLINNFFQKKDELLHIDNDQNELLYGKCGFIYSLLFCNRSWLKFKNYKTKILTIIYLLTNSIFNNGKKYAQLNQNKAPLSLYFEWHGRIYLGAAHGYAGILFTLYKTILFLFEHLDSVNEKLINIILNENIVLDRDVIKKELVEHLQLIYKVTDEILNLYVTDEFNVYSSVKKEKIEKKGVEKLIQWCHGNPGFIILLIALFNKENILKLKNVIDDDMYNNLFQIHSTFYEKHKSLIEKMGMLIWEKGLLIKGCGLCHGIAGNGIIFLYIYNYTKDAKWYTKALQYGYFCIQNFQQLYDVPDRPDSLFEGYAGLIVFLSFLLKPELTHFPAHDFSKAANDVIF